jgi:ComF family protein
MYGGVGKDLVVRLKFSGARAAALTVAGAMSGLDLSATCVIVPVPTATSRVRLRGYDQAVLISKILARQQALDYARAIYRTGQHRQVGASRRQRLYQMKQSFIIGNEKLVKGRHILLVDDVVTTGATLESAAAVLKAAGAKRVEAVVFARA